MITFVTYSPPGKITFNAVFCSTPAPLIKPQSAWNVRLGRRTGGLDLDVLPSGSKYLSGLENAPKYAFRDSPDSPQWGGDTTSPRGRPFPYSTPMRLCSWALALDLVPQTQFSQILTRPWVHPVQKMSKCAPLMLYRYVSLVLLLS